MAPQKERMRRAWVGWLEKGRKKRNDWGGEHTKDKETNVNWSRRGLEYERIKGTKTFIRASENRQPTVAP